MYQIAIARHLQGRGIFVTESRNEPNMAQTPRPGGKTEERPVILGRKLAAKERRSLLEVRNALADELFGGRECHLSPTTKESGQIAGPCMACPVCFTHGGLVSGDGGTYGRPGIVLYDDAFCVEGGDMEVLTLNAVDTQTQRTGQALATETFVYGGTFLGVLTLKHDAPELLKLVLDSVLSTHSYGARTRHYGRMENVIVGIAATERPFLTSYGLVGKAEKGDDKYLSGLVAEISRERGGKPLDMPKLGTRDEIMRKALADPSVQRWISEVKGYLKPSAAARGKAR
jgi:CRISPR type I-D-associated protein Csc2